MPELPLRRHSDLLIELLPRQGAAVLDVGCGDASLVAALRKRGAHAVGIEPGLAALAAAADRLGTSAALVRGQGESLPFATASFDAVVLVNSLHHLPPAAMGDALAEARRLLKHGGRLVVIEPAAEGPYFELVRSVEDETEVRELALKAVERSALAGWAGIDRARYAQQVVLPDLEALRRRFLLVDPLRAGAFAAAEPELARRFVENGIAHPDGGRAFFQPFWLTALRRGEIDAVRIIEARRGREQRAALAVRRAVFVEEQHVRLEGELDGLDGASRHLLALAEGDSAVGTLRWRRLEDGAAKIERVAVTRLWRGRGVGGLLMRAVLALLDRQGVETRLSAQAGATRFYERLGYVEAGPAYPDEGILHLPMRRARPTA